MNFFILILFIICAFLSLKFKGLKKEISELKEKILNIENLHKNLSPAEDEKVPVQEEDIRNQPEQTEQLSQVEPPPILFEKPVHTKMESSENNQDEQTEQLNHIEPPPIPIEEPVDPQIEVSESTQEEPVAVQSCKTDKVSHHTAEVNVKNNKKTNTLLGKWKDFKSNVDWELFTGTRLFAWLGVFALFIGILFFVKLSMDKGWLPPALRLAIGAIAGILLSVFSLKKMRASLNLLKQTLAASGIGTLYSVIFAATLYYNFLPKPAGFLLLSLISTTAFVLAVFHKGISISVLGAIGAFMTPLLVNTGNGNLYMLLLYLAVVNTGLFMVMNNLDKNILLPLGASCTTLTLGVSTLASFQQTSPGVIAIVWTLYLLLFCVFLLLKRNIQVPESKSFLISGILTFLSHLIVSITLIIFKPGWHPLLMLTAALISGIIVSYHQKGWTKFLVNYGILSFTAVFFWTVFRFESFGYSVSYILIFLYGATGCIGPLFLVKKQGAKMIVLKWFKLFPTAISALCLLGLVRRPECSFLFWPVVLGIQLLGIGISIIVRAFVQIVFLIVLFVAGGIFWLHNIPEHSIGFVFFAFIFTAGVLLTTLIIFTAKKLPGLIKSLNLQGYDSITKKSNLTGLINDHWLSAAPSAGCFVLIGASFMVQYPHYPNPGMVTLACFLILMLFFSKRILFEPSSVIALLSAVSAQSVWTLFNFTGLDTNLTAFIWAASFFCAAAIIPFVFYQNTEEWKKTWNTFAIFECIQFLFIIFKAKSLWNNEFVNWLPIIPVLIKLPLVVLLLQNLQKKVERNSILAFHGGVLLFYISSLPVLILAHGWLGLALITEASLILWLNTRINHPGLKKVSILMAPTGLFILLSYIPLLKTAESLPVLNPAVFAMIGTITALIFSVKFSKFPKRSFDGGKLKFDIPDYFLWLTLFSIFYLMHLIIADIFANEGEIFRVFPNGNFIQWASYSLIWGCFGAAIWKGIKSASFKFTGLIILLTGACGMSILPVIIPGSISLMYPFFNPGLYFYLLFCLLLYWLFSKESYSRNNGLIKNIFLGITLLLLFMMIMVSFSTLFQNGLGFRLLNSHNIQESAASASAILIFGFSLLIWKKRLDRPFRITGIILILISVIKSIILPLKFANTFGNLPHLFNYVTLQYIFTSAMLLLLAKRKWHKSWPVKQLNPNSFWAVIFILITFYFLNVEIAHCMGVKGHVFTFGASNNWGKLFGYSLSWLAYSIFLLVAGIKLKSKQIRWSAICLLAITSFKIFFKDLWSLGQLYRVGAFIGLAVALILVSYCYQRFLADDKNIK